MSKYNPVLGEGVPEVTGIRKVPTLSEQVMRYCKLENTKDKDLRECVTGFGLHVHLERTTKC